MQAWLHLEGNLHKMETCLEISLSCKRTPDINSRGYSMLCSLSMLPRKATEAQTPGHTDAVCSVCTTMTLTTQFRVHPMKIFVDPSNSQTARPVHRPGHWWSPGTVRRTLSDPLWGFFSSWAASSSNGEQLTADSKPGPTCSAKSGLISVFLKLLVIFRTSYPFEDLRKMTSIQDKDWGKTLRIKTLRNLNREYGPESKCREAGSRKR